MDDVVRIAEAHPGQESAWFRAEIAGDAGERAQLSLREALRANNPLLLRAVGSYYVCCVLARSATTSSIARLGGITSDVLERAMGFLLGRGARGLYSAAAARCSAGAPRVPRAASLHPLLSAPRCEWKLYARKRPLLAAEKAAGDVDACNASRAHGDVVCHAGKMRRSGRALDVQHTRFKLDAVFDESATNDEVCIAAVAPLLAWLAATRRRATLLFFGQTGTGKTHSLMGAADEVSRTKQGNDGSSMNKEAMRGMDDTIRHEGTVCMQKPQKYYFPSDSTRFNTSRRVGLAKRHRKLLHEHAHNSIRSSPSTRSLPATCIRSVITHTATTAQH